MADIELTKNPKKKREVLVAQFKKDYDLQDQLRALVFKEGLSVSSADQLDKNKIKLDCKLPLSNTRFSKGQILCVCWGRWTLQFFC